MARPLRIVERTNVNGSVNFIIQRKGWLFGWRDIEDHYIDGYSCTASYISLEDAQRDLCYYDDSCPIDKVVYNHV